MPSTRLKALHRLREAALVNPDIAHYVKFNRLEKGTLVEGAPAPDVQGLIDVTLLASHCPVKPTLTNLLSSAAGSGTSGAGGESTGCCAARLPRVIFSGSLS